MEKIFLNPSKKLVDEVVDWLIAKIENDASGAMSLAHIMVIMPTAQSGRSLRLRLAQRVAEKFGGGVLPPQVVQPIQLIVPNENDLTTASGIQLQAAFLKFIEQRPHRVTINDKLILKEWHTLFHAEFIQDYKSHLSFFEQLSDIWRILAGGGLLMSDVAIDQRAQECLKQAAGDEMLRWQELGSFETAFFEFLHSRGLRHEVEAIHSAKYNAKSLPSDIRQVVLPALADPVSVVYDVLRQQRDDLQVTVLLHADCKDEEKFDEWGRPAVAGWTGLCAPVIDGVRSEDVIRSGTDTELAQRIAADFPAVDEDLAVPSLGLCDETLFPELSAAFLNRGYELHNPERHPIAVSSLGYLIDALITVYSDRMEGIPWDALATLLRIDDVMVRLLEVCEGDVAEKRPTRAHVLEGFDVCRNAFLPQFLPTDLVFETSRLRTFELNTFNDFLIVARALRTWVDASFAESHGVAGFVRAMLQRIFETRTIGEDDKEFRMAAEAAREAIAAFDDEAMVMMGLSESQQVLLLRKAVSDASYALEPDSKQALKTEGWLELAWSASDKIALAGFNEGAVPDAVVGHAFLPDALRASLNLVTNETRLARDTFLFSNILNSRVTEPGSVRVYISSANGAGDLHRPSRLLFLVAPENLAARAAELFGDIAPSEPMPARVIDSKWRPRLPSEVPMVGTSNRYPDGRLSASAIDDWLKCPIKYLLQDALGMRRVEEKTELGADDFGTIVHRAMELYAREQLDRTAKGLKQLDDERDIVASLGKIMDGIRVSYASNLSVKLRLQLDAAEARVKSFARVQAQWAQDGWMIKEEPEFRFETRPFAGEEGCDIPMKGMIDRIDWKCGVGYRLIDYKTWDKRSGSSSRILKGGVKELDHAERLKLPVLNPGEDSKKRKRLMTVQLPLYGRCLEKFAPEKFKGNISDYCYAILGASAEDTCVLGSAFKQGEFEALRTSAVRIADNVELALETARVAIRRIRGNIFWPPGPGKEWKWNYKDVFSVSPEFDFPENVSQWRDEQEQRLDALNADKDAKNHKNGEVHE